MGRGEGWELRGRFVSRGEGWEVGEVCELWGGVGAQGKVGVVEGDVIVEAPKSGAVCSAVAAWQWC